MKKKLLVLAIAASFAACNSKPNPVVVPPAGQETHIPKSTEITAKELEDMELYTNIPGEWTVTAGALTLESYSFQKEGTYSAYTSGKESKGRWYIDGKKLRFGDTGEWAEVKFEGKDKFTMDGRTYERDGK